MSRFATREQMAPVIASWIDGIASDSEISRLSQNLDTTIQYVMTDLKFEFHTDFVKGAAGGGLDKADPPSKVHLETTSDVFDEMMRGRLDGAMAAMSGQLSFSGDMGAAMSLEIL